MNSRRADMEVRGLEGDPTQTRLVDFKMYEPTCPTYLTTTSAKYNARSKILETETREHYQTCAPGRLLTTFSIANTGTIGQEAYAYLYKLARADATMINDLVPHNERVDETEYTSLRMSWLCNDFARLRARAVSIHVRQCCFKFVYGRTPTPSEPASLCLGRQHRTAASANQLVSTALRLRSS